jgi:hypothetical protein
VPRSRPQDGQQDERGGDDFRAHFQTELTIL